jgi:hypothetical protein
MSRRRKKKRDLRGRVVTGNKKYLHQLNFMVSIPAELHVQDRNG